MVVSNAICIQSVPLLSEKDGGVKERGKVQDSVAKMAIDPNSQDKSPPAVQNKLGSSSFSTIYSIWEKISRRRGDYTLINLPKRGLQE